MFLSAFLAVVLVALLVEAVFGYPDKLYARIGHPVTWAGALIARLDRRMNRPNASEGTRRRAGTAALAILLAATVIPAWAVAAVLSPLGLVGLLVTSALASTLLAQRSLFDHVARVADAMETGGLEAGRQAVSQIVGRDPATLDSPAVCRAAIESLAENFSDGVTAPAVWLAAFGLPGGAAYKAINTADSMIGHRTPRHQAFGWAAARLDDLVNLPASRLTAVLIALAAPLAGGSARGAWAAVRRDARHHRSPNAGWPEAAMAGALGLRLAGPRTYGDTVVDDAWMGDGRAAATSDDIRRALRIYRIACAILWGFAAVLLALMLAFGR
ncbi:adenosylcobinamide-phosphate synthase CbiB [Amorphus orientalis]|uniref:Cobalamin biosynthesis protein CobD n=1 Tax=Amorphus orientalis TaxID=649198 RepID=A0AAE3VP89_9HYPH|nr:adenosylcobinamide-phosphate synthase CbiB [Amorphus orientalis]MDQ0315691.1 adenosylcobinamide-phosphate synthase [Amorphus orientalis]